MITIIAAVASNGVVGNNNQLPWPKGSIPRDMPHFVEQTRGGIVISGRKTYESMGLLKKRTNIIISSTLDEIEDATIYSNLREAIAVEKHKDVDISLLGGTGIWKEGMRLPETKRALITRVHHDFEGDTLFPEEELRKYFDLFYFQKWKEDEPLLSSTLEVWIRK
jgi:dihydrofolate reductase